MRAVKTISNRTTHGVQKCEWKFNINYRLPFKINLIRINGRCGYYFIKKSMFAYRSLKSPYGCYRT